MLHLACADELLTTTRAVRRRLDVQRAVPSALIEECIEVALQSPSSQNRQRWAFVVVTEADRRQALADLYRKAMESQMAMAPPSDRAPSPAAIRSQTSAEWLLGHMGDVPVLVVPCVERLPGDLPRGLAEATMYGSILPAAWSFMLAARARGLGSSWTTMHLLYEAEAAEIIGVPDGWPPALLIPVGFFTGTSFRPAPRRKAVTVTHWNRWGQRQPAGAIS
jgi:nitroreductase